MFKSIIGVVRSLFSKKIRSVGRHGFIYKKDGVRYFIDSEMQAGHYDVAIWAKSVRYHDDDKKHIELAPAEKKQIAEEIKAELESFAMKVDYVEFEQKALLIVIDFG